MKKATVFVLFLTFINLHLHAQNTEEEAVKKVINTLFIGMKTADSSLANTTFAKDCILQTIVNKEGKVLVKTENIADFLKFIGSSPKQKFDERIVFTKILIDGPLASVWADYKFYIDNNFSHCGVDSFQLVKTAKGWQIVYLIDTRRKEGCGF